MALKPTEDDSMESRTPTTAPSSPPDVGVEEPPATSNLLNDEQLKQIGAEEKKAHLQNKRTELARQKRLAAKKSRVLGKEAAEAKARELDELLAKSAAFSNILTKKTQVLGRVGSGFDGKALGEHDLEMAQQPKIMSGGTMRDYQLEGLTWMYEICAQGMSGILADEMGLGKTIQTISLIALLREKEKYLGPHLIVAPLSTLSNWVEEFQKWTPTVPVLLYHGDPAKREELRTTKITKHLENGRPTSKFPVVCTSYDIILRDKNYLSHINWEFIIIDEGHRLKNFNSQLFQELRKFTSATRLLISGTPLQNNLKELWSLLNFLLPTVFVDWEAFESWFDFSDLQDEEGTEEFIADQKKQELVKKIHLVLQPLLLRRIKADVEHMLPRKREYVLYAPMTEQQTELYDILSDKSQDARKYLENKVVERITGARNASKGSAKTKTKTTRSTAPPKVESDSEEEVPLSVSIRTRKAKAELEQKPATRLNAFEMMMVGKKKALPARTPSKASLKRKTSDDSIASSAKSVKSSRQSTPATVSKSKPKRKSYKEADASDEDKLSDDEFEAKLTEELAEADIASSSESDDESRELAKTLEMAKREIATKKLGNPLMQLRLVCNSPHNFYNPWSADSKMPIDETLVSSSGKMLLLDRLLNALFAANHKVLIFSQFKTQLDILEDYARDLRSWNVCRIDGGVAQDDRRQQIKDFNEDPEHRLFLLSTRAGGQGINLASADTVILFDSDWNPQQDLQAIDRAHRIGQTRPVVVFRLATKGTVEEELLMSADAKRRLEKLVIKKGGFRTMGQKMDNREDLDEAELRKLLLRDGQVYTYKGGDEILSDADLGILCDRSEDAYIRAEQGLGNAEGFKIVETKDGGLLVGGEMR
jgi:ATP-dependent DNA helicase